MPWIPVCSHLTLYSTHSTHSTLLPFFSLSPLSTMDSKLQSEDEHVRPEASLDAARNSRKRKTRKRETLPMPTEVPDTDPSGTNHAESSVRVGGEENQIEMDRSARQSVKDEAMAQLINVGMSQDDAKKAIKDEELLKMALSKPRSVKIRIGNRKSALKSKAMKEEKYVTLQLKLEETNAKLTESVKMAQRLQQRAVWVEQRAVRSEQRAFNTVQTAVYSEKWALQAEQRAFHAEQRALHAELELLAIRQGSDVHMAGPQQVQPAHNMVWLPGQVGPPPVQPPSQPLSQVRNHLWHQLRSINQQQPADDMVHFLGHLDSLLPAEGIVQPPLQPLPPFPSQLVNQQPHHLFQPHADEGGELAPDATAEAGAAAGTLPGEGENVLG